MYLSKAATAAYETGVANGTITDSIDEVINTVVDQEVVTYASAKGSYTFDEMDIIRAEHPETAAAAAVHLQHKLFAERWK